MVYSASHRQFVPPAQPAQPHSTPTCDPPRILIRLSAAIEGKEGTGRRALGQLLSPDVLCFTLEVSFYASHRDDVGLIPYTRVGYVDLGRQVPQYGDSSFHSGCGASTHRGIKIPFRRIELGTHAYVVIVGNNVINIAVTPRLRARFLRRL